MLLNGVFIQELLVSLIVKRPVKNGGIVIPLHDTNAATIFKPRILRL